MAQNHPDHNWPAKSPEGNYYSDGYYHRATLDVLQDIRGELKKLNAVFACHNFQAVPNILRAIRVSTGETHEALRQVVKNTTKKRKKRTVAK